MLVCSALSLEYSISIIDVDGTLFTFKSFLKSEELTPFPTFSATVSKTEFDLINCSTFETNCVLIIASTLETTAPSFSKSSGLPTIIETFDE